MKIKQKILKKIIQLAKLSNYLFLKQEKLSRCPYCNSKKLEFFYSKYVEFKKIRIDKCLNCDLCMQNPRIDKSSIDDFYNSVYRSKFDKKHISGLISRGKSRGKYIFEYIYENNKFNKSLSVLEYGCGYGGILEYFRDKSFDIYGIEKDVKLNESLNERNIKVFNGELTEYNKNIKFDLIILSHVLEHLYDPSSLINEAYKLLKPNGKLYIEVPGINNERIKKRYYSIQLGHLFYFNLNSMLNLIDKDKFNIVKSNENVQLLLNKI